MLTDDQGYGAMDNSHANNASMPLLRASETMFLASVVPSAATAG